MLYGKWKLAGAWSSLCLPALPAPELCAIRDTGHTVLSDVAAVVDESWVRSRGQMVYKKDSGVSQCSETAVSACRRRPRVPRAAARSSALPRGSAVPVAPAPGARKGHRHEAAGPAAHTSDYDIRRHPS